ncbi:hypothetical protein NDU88_005171 [Pleurodeles waltl]|uniref:Uncharacterized protein n=1 Tax=Pleurodeles waltl TaxID=8319 RepID=A0AAV7UH89_PLEWA|nr:hypothetical protein NDU88_005171 [Pleurodeles waltl]
MSLGDNCVRWVQLLDAKAMTRVLVGGTVSWQFPLSPLLFALTKEPLASWLRVAMLDWGIHAGEWTHMVSLCAENALLYLRHSECSIPLLLPLLSEFASISDNKVKKTKSRLLLMGGLMTLLSAALPLRDIPCMLDNIS